MVERIPMSLTGNKQLRNELDQLERVERHEIVKAYREREGNMERSLKKTPNIMLQKNDRA